MNIKMNSNYVLVDLVEEEVKTPSGLILTSTAIVPPCEGKVISVGKGKYNEIDGNLIPHDIEVGDIVIFGHASKNLPLEDGGKTYYVMRTDEIFGKRKQQK